METEEFTLPEPEAKAPKRKPAPRRRARSGGDDLKTARRNARNAARCAIRVVEADPEVRARAAAVLGCDDDVVEITAHILAPAKSGGSARTLDDLAAAEAVTDRIQRVLALADMGADRMAALREMMVSLDRVTGPRPANETALAVELADAVVGAGEQFEPVRELIG